MGGSIVCKGNSDFIASGLKTATAAVFPGSFKQSIPMLIKCKLGDQNVSDHAAIQLSALSVMYAARRSSLPAMCPTHDAFPVSRPCIDAEGELISRRGHRPPLFPKSPSSPLFTAGASEFFILPNAERHAATLTL